MKKWLVVCACLCIFSASVSWARTVILISIDGMRPDYVMRAEQYGLKLPNLEGFLTGGTYADGVIGAVPTVTYPNHTTLITGAWPAEHNILSNQTFDPMRKNQGGWYWYAQQIRVPTLWEAASNAGIKVASVGWPVSVGAKGVTYLIPEYWRARTEDDRFLIEALSRPEGWLEKKEETLGSYDDKGDGALQGDVVRTKYALEILRTEKPGFMTIHLAALDHAEHETGPFSVHSNETLMELDKMIGEIQSTALRNDPEAVIVIVSDHGFVRTDFRVNLTLSFISEGLIRVKTVKGEPAVSAWDATLWPAGGCAAVVLRDPSDRKTYEKVKALLESLKADPANGIARVFEQPEIGKMGAFPGAAFLIEMKKDYQPGYALSGNLVESIPSTGMHGYLPDNPELHASFFIAGKGIPSGRNLGTIDMRQIAPTLANLMGFPFPSARGEALLLTR